MIKINLIRSKKYLLLGDMLELGNHSKKLHRSIVPLINKTKIDKVFVKGKDVILIFKNLSQNKKGRILHSKSQIIELIKNDLNNNDCLMIKASNATGFNRIVKRSKKVKLMLYQFLLNFVDIYGFLNVFKYLTFRTGLSVFTSLIIVLIIGNPFIKFFQIRKF